MIYDADLYYFFDTKDFPFDKAFLVTAKAISTFCNYYYVEIAYPVKGYQGEKLKIGKLPSSQKEKESFIEELYTWQKTNTDPAIGYLYPFFIDPQEMKAEGILKEKVGLAKFAHQECDACCWWLNLTENEFKIVQKTWKKNGLPSDLFYPSTYVKSKKILWGLLG